MPGENLREKECWQIDYLGMVEVALPNFRIVFVSTIFNSTAEFWNVKFELPHLVLIQMGEFKAKLFSFIKNLCNYLESVSMNVVAACCWLSGERYFLASALQSKEFGLFPTSFHVGAEAA